MQYSKAPNNTQICFQTVLRQLDCLRQLVVVLCERSQLQDLVQFPYVNLHDEVKPSLWFSLEFISVDEQLCQKTKLLCHHQVVSIIESRARGLDLLAHNYYELLYAFHVNRHNYRKGTTEVTSV